MLIFSCLFLALGLLEAILAVVHDLAYRRCSLRSDLDEIEILLFCYTQSVGS